MPAILAKKLGMTQVFQEDGRVERVTVLQAGPCPVTAIRTHERDGYEAVQLAFGAGQGEAPHAKPSSATSRRPTRRRCATLVEFRDEAGELQVGETVTVEAFEVGAAREDLRASPRARASRARSSATTSASGPKSHGSHNVRAPGSIGASATPSRVFKGIRGPGQMGNKRVTQKGLEIVARRRRART